MNAPAQSRSPWMWYSVPPTLPLAGDAACDVCVVGAGIAGMSTAYFLAKKGFSVLVVDDGEIGGGMTSRTTAHLMTAIDDRYYEIERLHGEDGARMAHESHRAAVDAIGKVAEHERIDCEYERLDGYLFLPPGGDPDELLREYEAGLRAGVEGLRWVERAPIDGFDTGPCLCFPRQGQFHPLKYVAGLARAIAAHGGRLHRGHVCAIEDGAQPVVSLSGGARIRCGRAVVVATNTPIGDGVRIHVKQAPYLTYAVAARVPRGSVARALFWDTLDPYHYVRLKDPEGEVLIVGGEDHKTGQADDSERRFAVLELWMRERFPMAREVLHRWTGQVMETVDGLAFIGREAGRDNVYIATGDSGMGMTHGTIAGILLTDLIHGAEVPWAALYSPERVTLKASQELARENANVAWQYTDWVKPGEVDSPEQVAEGAGAVMRRGLHKIAIYRDNQGEVHLMSATCTHLGCLVRWNPADRTWDCPCHGSRYDALGHVLNGPAVADLAPVENADAPPVKPTQRPPGPLPGLAP
jgi:glycine/D-amino acid oxidase-like deaminating enzyme/nitrite reductase/ring-hydroxylating ferredoxin subunit